MPRQVPSKRVSFPAIESLMVSCTKFARMSPLPYHKMTPRKLVQEVVEMGFTSSFSIDRDPNGPLFEPFAFASERYCEADWTSPSVALGTSSGVVLYPAPYTKVQHFTTPYTVDTTVSGSLGRPTASARDQARVKCARSWALRYLSCTFCFKSQR